MNNGFVTDGTEFRLNTYLTNGQYPETVTGLSNGGFVVTWRSEGQDGSNSSIYARVYDSNHTPVGAEFRLHTATAGSQDNPSVVATSDGGFVATWMSPDSGGSGVYGARFTASGVRIGGDFQVDTTAVSMGTGSLSGLNDGRLVAIISGSDGAGTGLYLQILSATGARVGSVVAVNSSTTGDQRWSDVATLENGNFVVTWHTAELSAPFALIARARIFDSTGTPLGDEFDLSTSPDRRQEYVDVVALADGGFVATWSAFKQDGASWQIFARRFDAAGTPVGDDFLVNDQATGVQTWPSVTAMPDGGFVIVWQSHDGISTSSIYGRRYDSAGQPLSAQVFASATNTTSQSRPAIGTLANGSFVVAWDGTGPNLADGYARVFASQFFGTEGDDLLKPENVGNVLLARGGNDTIEATLSANDTFNGGEGFDLVSYASDTAGVTLNLSSGTATGAGIGSDVLISIEGASGGAGNDSLTGDAGPNILHGAGGSDTLIGGADNDTLSGGDGGDSLSGEAGGDLLVGGNDSDALSGGDGNDSLFGEAGNDTLNGGAGADTLDGGDGLDTASYADSDAAVFVDLDAKLASGGDAEGDVLIKIENLEGSASADTLIGSDGANAIFGGAGNDNIRGLRGRDTIEGGAGNDTINGDHDADLLFGGIGNDQVGGGNGNDTVYGGEGNDTVAGGNNHDYLHGEAGHDILSGGKGNDILFGGLGRDTLSGGDGADDFVFLAAAETGIGSSRDVINDFQSGTDDIDLSAFMSGGAFIGEAAFSGTAGEVRYLASSGILSGDVDGDGHYDFQLNILNKAALTADDFIF